MCSTRPPARSPRSRLRQPCRRSVPQRAPDRNCTPSSRQESGAVCFLASAGCERGVHAWRAVSAGRGDNELVREPETAPAPGRPRPGLRWPWRTSLLLFLSSQVPSTIFIIFNDILLPIWIHAPLPGCVEEGGKGRDTEPPLVSVIKQMSLLAAAAASSKAV